MVEIGNQELERLLALGGSGSVGGDGAWVKPKRAQETSEEGKPK